MRARHLKYDWDLSKDDVTEILDLARCMKAEPDRYRKVLKGQILGMIFQKPSTRTRVSFEAAMKHLGGDSIYMTGADSQIGRDEAMSDTARVLSRYVNILCARVNEQQTVDELAEYATVPVINALSDLVHPVQILADLLTIGEHWPDYGGLHLVFIGDGNNVCHSLMYGAAQVGMSMTAICPSEFQPKADVVKLAEQQGQLTGAEIRVTSELNAVKGANVVYTDTWTSMGQESEREERRRILHRYQVTAEVMAKAGRHAVFMHCLPAHRGEEVTTDVIDGEQSIVFDQAENRLHAQKALIALLLGAKTDEKTKARPAFHPPRVAAHA